MIAWLNPVALALVALAAVPVVIHLLLRRRAARVPFPSVRFIAPSDRSAIRLRRPNDLLLLVVRIAIVAAAALAVARPLVLTSARARALGERTIRAIVVDTSLSVDAASAVEAAAAEARGAFSAQRFDGPRLAEALAQASAWLAAGEPGRCEIVLVSDFQRGSIDAPHLERVPTGFGIRIVRTTRADADGRMFGAPSVLHEGEEFSRRVQLNDQSTTVRFTRTSASPGLDIAADPSVAERIRRAVSAAGAVAPSPTQPIRVRFTGRHDAPALNAGSRSWAFDAARKLLASPDVHDAPLRAWPSDGELVIDSDAQADSLSAAEVVHSALNARLGPSAFAEHEPGSIPQKVLDSWMRRPSAPDADAWRRSTESDGRWFWLIALGLMLVETYLRRRKSERSTAAEVPNAA